MQCHRSPLNRYAEHDDDLILMATAETVTPGRVIAQKPALINYAHWMNAGRDFDAQPTPPQQACLAVRTTGRITRPGRQQTRRPLDGPDGGRQ